jgi:hypothetical protein
MTLTTPSDGPTLLVALIRTDHDRLVELLHEAAVPTPTPGVADDLRRQLTASVSAHLNAEAVVALGAIREVLGADAHAKATEDSAHLHGLVHALSEHPTATWVEDLRAAIEDHRRVMEADLLPKVAERAPELTATLGYRFSDVIEGASRKP